MNFFGDIASPISGLTLASTDLAQTRFFPEHPFVDMTLGEKFQQGSSDYFYRTYLHSATFVKEAAG